ncbi:MAG: NAD-dependent epimerase/dehydratase family protein [Candidatus Pacearchaeota archaeon]|nr:NAD-dependent epimerase/dehydratase family protein [Candidatus Pacearchaeota archaeon]
MAKPKLEVLVTGGLGFLGSHLVPLLLNKGDSVTIVDNKQSNAVKEDFYAHRNGSNCRVVPCDVASFQPYQKFDQIYHLAAVVGPVGILPYAGKIGPSELNNLSKLIFMAQSMDAKLLDISTSEVYGPRSGALSEDDDCIMTADHKVRQEYGLAKLLGEKTLISWCRQGLLKANAVRPFNISGERQRAEGGFVLPRFFEAASKSKPITVYEDGTQRRAFTHAEDISRSLIAVMGSQANGEIFNVGNPANEISIQELARLIKHVTQSPSEIVNVDPVALHGPLFAEAYDKVPKIDKIRRVVGWEPKISLYDILSRIAKSYGVKDPKPCPEWALRYQ